MYYGYLYCILYPKNIPFLCKNRLFLVMFVPKTYPFDPKIGKTKRSGLMNATENKQHVNNHPQIGEIITGLFFLTFTL